MFIDHYLTEFNFSSQNRRGIRPSRLRAPLKLTTLVKGKNLRGIITALLLMLSLPVDAFSEQKQKIKVSPNQVFPVTMSDSNTIYCLGMPGSPGLVKRKKKYWLFTPLTPIYDKKIAVAARRASRKPSEKNKAKLNMLIEKLAEMQSLCSVVTPPPDPDVPLSFSEVPRVADLKPESATIIFQTTKASNAEVFFGTIEDALDGSVKSTEPVSAHRLVLLHLEPNTTYHANIKVTDNSGAKAEHRLSFLTPTQLNQLTLEELATIQTREGQTTKSPVKANGAGTEEVEFVVSNGPSFVTVKSLGGSSGEITVAPSLGTVGDYSFEITATSSDGRVAKDDGKVKVYPALPPEPPAGEPGIFMGAELAHKDRFLPNFGHSFNAPGQTITESQQNGNWSNLFSALSNRSILVIRHQIVFDVPLAVVDRVIVYPGGSLSFRSDINTELRVTTLQVMKGALLQVGTAANPIRDNVSAVITFRDVPFNLDIDPGQYGNGLINFGTVYMYGRVLSKTWVRLAAEPKAGDTALRLSEAVTGWMPGDKIIIPDSAPISNLTPEVNTIDKVVGNLLYLKQPIAANHLGARNFAGTLEYLPHVANLKRNVVLRSENPSGTRGHTIHLGRAHLDMRYVLLEQLGRTKALVPGIIEKTPSASHLHSTIFNADGTPHQIGTNQIGRYALHFHHAIGPVQIPTSGYQQVALGLAVDGSPKWGIAIHGSHYTLVKENVIYASIGAGIVTEDGSETENVITRNFVAGSKGSGQTAVQRDLGLVDFAHEGAGFWFHSGNNRVTENVAANNIVGFNDFRLSLTQNLRYPISQGDNPHATNQGITDPRPDRLPFLDFSNNEAYAGKVGLELWNVHKRVDGVDPLTNPRGDLRSEISTMKNSVIWHQSEKLVFAGNGRPNTFRIDGLVGRMYDPRPGGPCIGLGVSSSSAYTQYLEFNKLDIEGAQFAIDDARHGWILSNSRLQNCRNITTEFALGIDHTIRNTVFQAVPGKSLDVLYMKAERLTEGNPYFGAYTFGAANPARFLIYDHQGIPGNNREVFIPQQLAQSPMYSRNAESAQIGCPQSGLTVRQCFDQYGLAPLGQVATCTQTELGFNTGPVCPFSGAIAPPMQYNPQPRVLVGRPRPGENISLDARGEMYFTGAITGSPMNVKGNNIYYYQLDNLAPVEASGYYGTRSISLKIGNLAPGPHTIRVWLVDSKGVPIPGSQDLTTFTVLAK